MSVTDPTTPSAIPPPPADAIRRNLLLAIDPGYVNCGVVVLRLEDGGIAFMGGVHNQNKGHADLRSLKVLRYIDNVVLSHGRRQFAGLATELYTPPPKKIHPGSILSRGGLDTLIRLRYAHLPFAITSPSVVKKFASGNGNAKKDQMYAHIWTQLVERHREWADYLHEEYSEKKREHILEAWMIGEVARLAHNDRWQKEEALGRAQRLVMQKAEVWTEALAEHPLV